MQNCFNLQGAYSVVTAKQWAHQAKEYQIGRDKRARALIWPMRSGKTKACIDKAVYQHTRGTIEGVIVIAPNGVHINWVMNEIPKWAPKSAAFAWETTRRVDFDQMAKFEAMLGHAGLKWFAINMEALKHLDCRRDINKFLVSCRRKFMLIVSESHHFGHAGAKRTYFARSLARHAAFRQIESGTPLLNSPLRAFSQYELLEKGALGFEKYTQFALHFATFEKGRRGNGRTYQKVAAYKNMDELRSKLVRFSSVVLRDEIHDMPALLSVERPIVMSEAQRRAYLQMVSHHLAEIGDNTVEAAEGGVRVQKLQQILNGYLMQNGEIITVDDDAPIYDALIDEVYGTLPGKTLIWCRYREDIRRVVAKLRRAGFNPLEYHGGVPMRQREPTRRAFHEINRYNPMVGQPGAGGEGLDFSAADAVLYFSAVPNAIMIRQSEERATVKGGRTVSLVRLRSYGTVDDRIWQIVDGKASLADSVSGTGLRDLLLQTEV